MASILVINPNSNHQVTENLRGSLADFDADTSIDCVTIPEGPFGIESDDDVDSAAALVVDRIGSDQDYDAYVIACYSDPGLSESRRSGAPVFGIQESALKAATKDGRRFGVLALSDESIARHLAYIDRLGLGDLLAAELPLDISVEQSAGDPGTLARVIVSGRRLIDEFGAEAVVLGCAGMAALREAAEQALGVPVIEPVRAAVDEAIETLAPK